mmetsp:Transcript_11732/g.26910  ORF Transcript_11732/g.26910 Transcript_11732/m.26910 type:complete len:88 (-) Transcript_11732:612-875(-)
MIVFMCMVCRIMKKQLHYKRNPLLFSPLLYIPSTSSMSPAQSSLPPLSRSQQFLSRIAIELQLLPEVFHHGDPETLEVGAWRMEGFV